MEYNAVALKFGLVDPTNNTFPYKKFESPGSPPKLLIFQNFSSKPFLMNFFFPPKLNKKRLKSFQIALKMEKSFLRNQM